MELNQHGQPVNRTPLDDDLVHLTDRRRIARERGLEIIRPDEDPADYGLNENECRFADEAAGGRRRPVDELFR